MTLNSMTLEEVRNFLDTRTDGGLRRLSLECKMNGLEPHFIVQRDATQTLFVFYGTDEQNRVRYITTSRSAPQALDAEIEVLARLREVKKQVAQTRKVLARLEDPDFNPEDEVDSESDSDSTPIVWN